MGDVRTAPADGQAQRARGRVDVAGGRVGAQRRGQQHQTVPLHAQEGHLAGHGLEATVRLAPAEFGADGRGQGLAVRRGRREFPDTVQFGRAEGTAAVGGQPGSASGGRDRARRSDSVMLQGQKARRSWGACPRFAAQAVR